MICYQLVLYVVIAIIGVVQGWWFISTEKCYDINGSNECFSTEAPFSNTDHIAPDSPDSQRVRYLLFTPSNPNTAQTLLADDAGSITASNFDPAKTTRIIIHGYNGKGTNSWIEAMTKELLDYDGSNVIAIDWRKGAHTLMYGQAASNTRVVGALAAALLRTIVSSTGVRYSGFHLIGHSLGAHIAGYIGRRLQGRVGRISGMDPAGPNFDDTAPEVRLDPTDAVFVDVLHTDGDRQTYAGFGTYNPLSDADFYPNGGEDQPGCPQNVITMLDLDMKGVRKRFTCDHKRAVEIYTESINTKRTYKAYPCDTIDAIREGYCRSCGSRGCSRVGFHALHSQYGMFYLTTNSVYPYCKE